MNGLLYRFLFKVFFFFKKKISSVWVIVAILLTLYIICGAKSCSAKHTRERNAGGTNEAQAERELLDSNRRVLDEPVWSYPDSEDAVFGSLEPVGVD